VSGRARLGCYNPTRSSRLHEFSGPPPRPGRDAVSAHDHCDEASRNATRNVTSAKLFAVGRRSTSEHAIHLFCGPCDSSELERHAGGTRRNLTFRGTHCRSKKAFAIRRASGACVVVPLHEASARGQFLPRVHHLRVDAEEGLRRRPLDGMDVEVRRRIEAELGELPGIASASPTASKESASSRPLHEAENAAASPVTAGRLFPARRV
jgi:hypothetical protein